MIPFPNKKYAIIYADPPWKYRLNSKVVEGAADGHYSVMEIEDIANLPVQEICSDKCLLFLWVTFPKLKEGIYVLEKWGFEYKTVGFTWFKTNCNNGEMVFGIGYYTKSNVEICLLGTKGNAHQLVKNNSISQVITSPRRKHSKKPDEVRQLIVKLCGDVPRIELFARSRYNGWDVWGNETDG
jgi:N6-adenosine-specific RNA methylase IME4